MPMTLAFAISALAVVSGCSSSGKPEVASTFASSPTDSVTTSTPTGPPDLRTASLAVSDLPTGWTVSTDATAVSLGENGCLKTAGRRTATKTSRYLTFAGPGAAPVFSESLAYFPASAIAANYADAVKALNGCRKVSIKAGKVTLTGILSPTSAPTVGLESKLYTLIAPAGGHVLTEYILVSHTARILMLTSYATVKNPSIGDFLTLSGKAAAKLS